MMKSLSTLLILLFISSGSTKIVHKDLHPYVDALNSYIKPSCKPKTNYIFTLGKLENPSWIGVCKKSTFTMNITIDPGYWATATSTEKLDLLAHEMTHCYFDEPHSKDKMHYMYYLDTYNDKSKTLQQFIEMVKSKDCLSYED